MQFKLNHLSLATCMRPMFSLTPLKWGAFAAVLLSPLAYGDMAEYEAWKKQHDATYQHYVTQQHAEFEAYKNALESEWEAFKLAVPRTQYSTPKIDKPPVAPTPASSPKPKIEPIHIEAIPVTPQQTQPVTKPKEANHDNDIQIVYLGQSIWLPKMTPTFLPLSINKTAFTDAWESIQPALAPVADAPVLQPLTDWERISLLNQYASQIAGEGTHGSQFILWSLLLQMGYDVRLAYDDHALYVLMPSQQTIYEKPSIPLNGETYYVLVGAKPTGSLYTFTAQFRQTKSFNFAFKSTFPTTGLTPKVKTITDKTDDVSVSYQVYPQLGDYYRHHPMLDFVWYFRATPHGPQYQALIDALKKKLHGQSQTTQVQTLLSLVQHGFNYERDDEQWGEEYYASPMHTLMLNAVDCEDRSFLFAYLVEQVVGVKTVGLKYPGHLAVAVALPQAPPQPNASYVSLQGQKYYVADPTYIGARIGQTMTKFEGIRPDVIVK